ncbi:MAG: hypothetical protein ACK4TA_14725 [Saprospiraceae bacterium]
MNTLRWERRDQHYELKQQHETLVRLQYDAIKDCVFSLGNQQYAIHRAGFWNPVYIILQQHKTIATLRHSFWGSGGNIQFSDSAVYQVEYKYKNTLTLCILDADKELLRYYVIKENNKNQGFLQLGIHMEDAERLLQLATLAMVVFLSIFNEFNSNGGDDVIIDLIHLAS